MSTSSSGDFAGGHTGPTAASATQPSADLEEQLAEQLPVELQPTFTDLDEQKERISMSIEDIYKVQSDLTGVTLDMAGLSMTTNSTSNSGGVAGGGGASTYAGELHRPEAPVAGSAEQPLSAALLDRQSQNMALLRRLDDELAKLPAHQTVVYREAKAHHPHLVTDEVKMQFLDCEEGDVALAAVRLVRHWGARLDVFGSDRCFLPMTAEGAMRGQIEPMIRQGIDTVLPVTDATGRAIILVDGSKRNFDVYSFAQEIQGMFYLVQCLAENDEIRKRGLVFLMDGRNMQRSHYSRKISIMSQVIFHCMPIRCRAFHVFPNWLVHYVLTPVIKRIIPKGLRMRLKFHYGTTDAILTELDGFNLPKSRLPVQLGGDVVTDMNQWIAERIALETVKSANVAPSSDGISVPAAKKARGMSEASYAKIGSKKPSSMPVKTTAAVKKRRGRRFGRKSDPRMARAIEIKAANEDMSLQDALIAGGYAFHYNSEILDKVDEDGISLTQVSELVVDVSSKIISLYHFFFSHFMCFSHVDGPIINLQRKNNLCRRMRQRRTASSSGQKLAAVSSGTALSLPSSFEALGADVVHSTQNSRRVVSACSPSD